MAFVKIVLRKKINKDGEYPLCIRITKDRKSSYITLEYRLKESDWDAKEQKVKSSYPNSKNLNNFLRKKLYEVTNQSLELETIKDEVSSFAVKQKMKPKSLSTFNKVTETYLQDLKNSGKYNRYVPDKSRITRFQEFLKNDYSFSDITPSLIERFLVYLRSDSKRPISERTVINHLVVIRSVFSYAIKSGITDKKYYPFGKDQIKIKFPESNKIGLATEEIKALEEVELATTEANHARNLWLFSFYFAGMRISDVLRLKWTDFQNDRLYYSMGKNLKSGSLKIPQKAIEILEQYKPEKVKNDDLVFPDLKVILDWSDKFIVQRTIAYAISRLDKTLRKEVITKTKITKKLTMHIARHSFGNLSGNKIPIQMLQKLYRHSNVSTTIGYQSNFIHEEADDALNSVIDF
ncbi:MAG: site-specific integrase [Bacteroidota bacterium]